MGKIKAANKDYKSFVLTEREFNYLQILNNGLTFHTWKDKIMSGFLYYVCTNRLGYKETANLIFELDFEDDKHELKIRDVPPEAIEQVKQSVDRQSPEE